jgi:O-antigen/teichoic acid export membrane protein
MLLLARRFSTEIYGEVVTLFTLSMVFVILFDFGLPAYMQREISINPVISGEIFSRIFSTGILLFTGYILAGSIYVKIFYPNIPFVLFIIIAVTVYGSSLVTLCNRALSGLNNFRNPFTAFILPRILILIFFILGLYRFSFSLNLLMIIMLGGFLLNLVLVLFYTNAANIKYSVNYFSFKSIKSIIKFSIPLGLAVIFNFLYDKIDILLISKLRSFDDVAFYNIGYGLFKASALSFSFLLVSGFTKVSAISKNKEDIRLFLKDYSKIILAICVPLAVILFIFSEFIIKILYTEKFEGSIIVLKILTPGVIAMGLNNLTGVVLNGMGYFRVVMYITLYGFVLNVVLNVIFIPQYGIIAAAVLTVITEYFIFITEFYYLRKILKLN